MVEKISYDVEEIIQEYATVKKNLYDKLKKKGLDLFNDLFEAHNISVQNIEGRSKDIESLKNKLQRKIGKYNNPLNEITDLCGIRIITYYLEDIDKISDIIKEEFIVDYENSYDKLETMNTNEFGYRSVHFVVQISEERSTLSEWRGLSALKFEIQLRTVLQHAWAGISHLLQYKQELDVPSTLIRRLSRLAGLIELADEEFTQIRDQQESLKLRNKEADSEINLLSIINYMESPTSNDLVELIAKLDKMSCLAEADDGSISDLISICDYLGIKRISQLDSIVNEKQYLLYPLLNSLITSNYREWIINKPFMLVLFLIGLNQHMFTVDKLREKFNFSEKIAHYILDRFALIKEIE